MLIENVEAFKTWLAKLLEPICDADPSALANYVIALVKKDKSDEELKAICADQLDVFLQKETNDFVDKLFESLRTRSYLPLEDSIKEEEKDDASVPGLVQDSLEEERENRKRKHSSPRNRSDSSERRARDKKREDGKWRDYDRHRDRYDWRRGRSKSPSKSKSTNKSRSRSRGRSRDREITRSRDHRERTKFESERNELESAYNPVSQAAIISTEQQPYSSGGQAIPSTVTVIAPAHHPESTTEIWSNYYSNHNPANSYNRHPPPKRRCRDYDERGFCVLGDLCQFDHGNDPLVVDEVSLPSMIPFPPPPGLPPPGILLPPIPAPAHNMRMPIPRPLTQPPPVVHPAPRLPLTHTGLLNNREQPGTSTVPSLAPVGGRLPPPLPPQNLLYSVSEHTYEPDGYNPEAPSLTGTGRTGYRPFYTRPQQQRSNLIGLTSGDMDTPPRAANIVIQTEPPPAAAAENSNTNRVVVEPDRKRPLGNMNDGPFAKKPWSDKLMAVAFQGDPEGALIQYLTNEEARRAISSTEAVLNNRFIRVLWHRENNEQQPSSQSQPHLTHQHTTHRDQAGQQTVPSAGLGHLQKGSYVINKLPPKHRLGAAGGTQADPTYVASNQNTSVEENSEALKLQQDMRKKKQEMLEKQIEYQKMLISKLEKNKTMKAEERMEIMKTLKVLDEKISQVKDELKTIAAPSKVKSKTEVYL
ncbi:RNA-binding protein 27 [Pyxicephalus adspersus]|uniref:RNA-binding protein 27 n=1 Tax=Pyxicephalus adspersus TaxID=30357 RepID=UPI003B5906A5